MAHQSRILKLELNHPSAPALASLEAAATGAGMHCRTIRYEVHGHHPPPPSTGLQCTLPEDPAFFEVFTAMQPEQLLIRIYASSESTPQGGIDPAIDRLLQEFRQTLIDDHNLKTVLECLTPDLAPCLKNST